MLFLFPLLLSSALLPGANGAVFQRQNSDKEVIAHYSTTGNCFWYVDENNKEKSYAPCKTWCKEEKHVDTYGVRLKKKKKKDYFTYLIRTPD